VFQGLTNFCLNGENNVENYLYFVLPILLYCVRLHCVELLFITVFLSNKDFMFYSPALFML